MHAVVPGGGPSLDGNDRWLTSRRPWVKTCNGKYLVDAGELRLRFRESFLSGLKRLYANGKLKLEGEWAHLHHCERYVAECRGLLQAAGILPVTVESPLDRQESVASAEEEEARLFEKAGLLGDPTTPCCAGCGAVLVCIASDARASWFSVMHSPLRPSWYNDG